MNNPNKRRVEIDFLKLDQYKYNQSVWKLMETEYSKLVFAPKCDFIILKCESTKKNVESLNYNCK